VGFIEMDFVEKNKQESLPYMQQGLICCNLAKLIKNGTIQ